MGRILPTPLAETQKASPGRLDLEFPAEVPHDLHFHNSLFH